MTIDVDGKLWVAIYNGWKVILFIIYKENVQYWMSKMGPLQQSDHVVKSPNWRAIYAKGAC